MNEFLWPIRVYYEDTDSGGVVYHSNYLHFMERARTEWLRELGLEQDELTQKNGVLFAVRAVNVEYHLPARFNEQLLITTKVQKISGASIILQQIVTKQGQNTVLCSGTIKIVSLQVESFRPCPLPALLLGMLKQQ